MANPEHVEILKQGVEVWNEWRARNPTTTPDLSHASFNDSDLSGANLNSVNCFGSNLQNSILAGVYLTYANLRTANMSRAVLRNSNLYGADLRNSVLVSSDLFNATLKEGILNAADLTLSNLQSAKFNKANLSGASLMKATLRNTEFGYTILGNTDLANTIDIDTCLHAGPSMIDIQTLIKAKDLPLSFLRGCGLPDIFIEYLPSLFSVPIQFYSCFISYSSKDQDLAERLHADLQNKGVRCWFAPEDLKIGAEIRTGIDESIHVHDKLLLVLSEASVKSRWVQQEVETALAKERKQERTVLFPIRLDDAVMQINTGWPAYLKNTRNIGNFTGWKAHDSYQKAFDRLLRDLKAEDKQAAEG